MKTAVPFLLFLFLGALRLAAAAPEEDPFSQANRAFAEGRYDEAARGYEALLSRQGFSAPVLFDLGNAYFRAGKTGRALACYERARLLSPRDADLLANQALAARKAGLPPEEGWRRAVRLLAPDEGAWLLAGAVTLACLGFLAAALIPGPGGSWGWRRFLRAAGGLLGLLALAAAAAGAARIGLGDLRRAWVVEADAPVRISPFTEAKTAFTLPDGAPVTVQGAHQGFLLIRDAKGERGWIERDRLAPLLPRPD